MAERPHVQPAAAPAPPELAAEQGITREGLELVIRRAAELAAQEADADDRLSEAEVLRIAEELGLPGRHVRRALYELPRTLESDAGLLARWYGEPTVLGARVVSGPPEHILARLEDYLVTREFLQVLRKQGGRASFQPADDAISNVARAVRRPQRQWQIARARRVLVEVRPMPGPESHVRLELDLSEQRSSAVRGGLVGGVLVGIPVAAGAFFPVDALILPVLGDAVAYGAGVLASAGAFTATVAGGLTIARNRFRTRVENARLEIASLLDRLEGGGRLDPPPAPWLRSLRSRIAETLRHS